MLLERNGNKNQFNAWQCAFCGQTYIDGEVCPLDDSHWEEFLTTMTRPETVYVQRGAA
jgi:hypothetical protein